MVRRWLRGLLDLADGLSYPPRGRVRARWCPVGREWTNPMTESEFAEHVLLARRMRERYGPPSPDPVTGDGKLSTS